MKTKQILCIILILSCILSGCSKNSTKDTGTTPKGRYMEKTIALPEDMNKSSLSLTKKDSSPLIYSYSEDPFSIVGYQLDQNGTWVDATPAWLKSLTPLPKGWSYRPQIMVDAKGNQYLYYTELIGEQSLKANLLRSKDGKTYETLKPEGWDEVDPTYNNYPVPAKITVMVDGTLAALMYSGEVLLYDAVNYKLQNTISETRYTDSFLSSIDNQLILGESGDRNAVKGIDVYNLSDMKSINYPFVSTMDSYVYCDTSDQNILICNADGIYKLEQGTSVWNCIVDGTLTSLAMPTMWSTGFVSDASNNYYVLYNSEAGYSLKQYYFDATVDTLPSKELNIYALIDNSTLRQAAAVFQQNHTDVKVNFTTAMSKEEYDSCDDTTKEDYIRALNTELLAGDSYDILVLDELPTDSYVEKGVLADISDILKPLIDDGTLLNNIMDSYLKNDKIYCVPARFGVNLLMGGSSDIKQLTTLNTLVEYTLAHKDNPVFGSFTVDDLVNTFVPFQINSLLNEDGKINRDNLIQALNTLKQISDTCGIVENYDGASVTTSNTGRTVNGGNNMWNMTEGNYLCLNTAKSFLDAMYPFGLLTYIKGTYTSFENSFTPYCELGINSKGKQLELSKEFLSTVLSEEVQKNDFYDGFPINAKALTESSLQDRSEYSGCTNVTNADGTEGMLYFNPLDAQQSKDVAAICTSVSNKPSANDHLAAAIKEKANDFFSGNQSASDAADAIIEGMNVYLAE